MSGPGAFTQLVPEHLAAIAAGAACPRTRRGLEVAALAAELAGEADWRSGRVSPWSSRRAAHRHHRRPWRLKKALGALAAAGVVTQGPGELLVDLDRVRHRPGTEGPPFVQLLPGAVGAFAAHHGLSRLAADVLTHLVLFSAPSGQVEETSQAALAGACGTAWATMHAVLAELSQAGAVEAHFARGRRVGLVVGAKAALVRPVPGPAGRRGERRAAGVPGGPADEAGERIWAHFGLPGPAPRALVAVLRQAVRDGAPPAGLAERVVAEGPLSGLRDPGAGLVARAQAAARAYQEAARSAAEARQRQQEAQQLLAARSAAEVAEDAQAGADSRFVASVLAPADLARLAASQPSPFGRPGPRLAAAQVLVWARRAVAARPELTPAEALAYALVHPPPPGPAPPIGADAAGPGIAEVLARHLATS